MDAAGNGTGLPFYEVTVDQLHQYLPLGAQLNVNYSGEPFIMNMTIQPARPLLDETGTIRELYEMTLQIRNATNLWEQRHHLNAEFQTVQTWHKCDQEHQGECRPLAYWHRTSEGRPFGLLPRETNHNLDFPMLIVLGEQDVRDGAMLEIQRGEVTIHDQWLIPALGSFYTAFDEFVETELIDVWWAEKHDATRAHNSPPPAQFPAVQANQLFAGESENIPNTTINLYDARMALSTYPESALLLREGCIASISFPHDPGAQFEILYRIQNGLVIDHFTVTVFEIAGTTHYAVSRGSQSTVTLDQCQEAVSPAKAPFHDIWCMIKTVPLASAGSELVTIERNSQLADKYGLKTWFYTYQTKPPGANDEFYLQNYFRVSGETGALLISRHSLSDWHKMG